jgi:hypothetical protein
MSQLSDGTQRKQHATESMLVGWMIRICPGEHNTKRRIWRQKDESHVPDRKKQKQTLRQPGESEVTFLVGLSIGELQRQRTHCNKR